MVVFGRERGRTAYGYFFDGGFELVDVSGNDHDVCAFFCELDGYAFAHAL